MVKSMTAFAKEQNQGQAGIITWELRSVNSRFLDINFRLPEFLRELETELRNVLKKYLVRGKVDIILNYMSSEASIAPLQVNHALLQQLNKAVEDISNFLMISTVDPIAVLRWPGMLQVQENNTAELKNSILNIFEKALQKLNLAREREGAELTQLILSRLEEILKLINQVASFMPEVLIQQKQRLIERFNEAKVELESERLAQEMVLFSQKIDISEEIERLMIHVAEMKRILQQETNTIGRRLDFLTQEMHREANTLGSKSTHEACIQLAIDLKVIIEQIREQVQNIE
ncbi:MAG: YicC family protein [Gammaproteobacteria bacterium RIFCSPHIGHO2_12_FULL_35_23]|nr:MAG: YicC family protein [Gammaproteobacteria bacterium RIFCSPHIGHO2_12_FULL_35_23]